MINEGFFTVKILEAPRKLKFFSDCDKVEFTAQLFTDKRYSEDLVLISMWGLLAEHVASFYRIYDYVLVEGAIRIQNTNEFEPKKFLEIAAARIYPILLEDESLIRIMN